MVILCIFFFFETVVLPKSLRYTSRSPAIFVSCTRIAVGMGVAFPKKLVCAKEDEMHIKIYLQCEGGEGGASGTKQQNNKRDVIIFHVWNLITGTGLG